MRGVAAVVSSVCLCLLFVPGSRVLDAQALDDGNRPGPLSVHVGVAATLPNGNEYVGDAQSVSIGYSPTPKVTLLASGWRMRTPTRMRRYSGVTTFNRGDTAQFVSGEVHFRFGPVERVAPYAFVGGGIGISRPNVDDTFPDRVTNFARVMIGGGGLSWPVGQRLNISGDLGFHLIGERDALRLMLPLRASLAWRF
jgi:hypothetical protein